MIESLLTENVKAERRQKEIDFLKRKLEELENK